MNVIVAFATEEGTARCAATLEEAGIPVFRRCTCASEVKRAMDVCGGGVLVTACRLPDSTADALMWDLGKRAVVVAVGRPAQLELCEHPDVFRLSAPCSKGELTSAVNMLIQLQRMRLPRREDGEKQAIHEAKKMLMRKYGMTEPEAHHHLQKGAMDACVKMGELAAKILETDGQG